MPNPTGGKPFAAPFRLTIPYVGETLVLTGILLDRRDHCIFDLRI